MKYYLNNDQLQELHEKYLELFAKNKDLGTAAAADVSDEVTSDNTIPTGAAIIDYIESLDHGSVKNIETGPGLVGGPITKSGTIKVSLVDETPISSTSSPAIADETETYPVILDGEEHLAVTVPSDYVKRAGDEISNLTIGTRVDGSVIGNASFAQGMQNVASGNNSHAEGQSASATGNNSHAEGEGSVATSAASHAEGSSTKAQAVAAHAEGVDTTASAMGAHSEGQRTSANSMAAHAEGSDTMASGTYSHAEGLSTTSSGQYSHAEGNNTIASGAASHAEGVSTVARGNAQHVSGRFNEIDTDNTYAEIVGNGNSNERSNAYTLDWQGNAVYAGTVTVGSNPVGAMDVTTKQYTDSAIGAVSSSIPTDVSDLNNDAGYITIDSVPTKVSDLNNDTGFITASALPTKVSDLINDAEYITSEDIQEIPDSTSDLVNDSGFITAEALPTRVSDLTNDTGFITAADLPTNVSELNNDSGYITSAALPTNVSQLTNDAGYVTQEEVEDIVESLPTEDTHVEVTLGTTDKAYLLATTTTPTDTPANVVAKADSNVYLDVQPGALTVGGRDPNGTVGIGSFAQGNSVIASGDYSHAEGFGAQAVANHSHAEGSGTTSLGAVYSHAEGYQTVTNSSYSHAEGYQSVAGDARTGYGQYSHAEGLQTTASYTAAHAEGSGSTASGQGSHAEGMGTRASSDGSHAEGQGTRASFDGAHSEGGGTVASGQNSHAEGGATIASESCAHAEGGGTTAEGQASHAEGDRTTASGRHSHAEGSVTYADGDGSHAEGLGTVAESNYQHVSGKYNIGDYDNTYAEIVGNGDENNASNARTLDWSGNAVYAGKATVGAGPTEDMDLATKEYVDDIVADIPVDTSQIYYGVCSDVAATADKTVTLQNGEGFELKTGVVIAIQFNSLNQATNPTLNVNGTGAKAIKLIANSAPGTLEYVSSWRSGETVLMIYDGTYWRIIKPNYVYADSTYNLGGIMSAQDKKKLDGIETNAEVNVQSDWNETSILSDAFILNKPDIPQNTSDLVNDSNFISAAVLQSKSASGNPIVIHDAAPAPAEELIVDINPHQDFNGYDHPWAEGQGKNLLPYYEETGTWRGITFVRDRYGVLTLNGTATQDASFGSSFYLPVGEYYFSGCQANTDGKVDVYMWETAASKRMKQWDGTTDSVSDYGRSLDNQILSQGEDIQYKYTIRIVSGYTCNNVVIHPMIRRRADADGSYVPYSNICPITGNNTINVVINSDTIPIALGRTAYGGTVDVTTGILTVTDALIASYNGESLPSTWISDRDEYSVGGTPTIGAQVVYTLAEPQTYQLTPTQVNLLLKENTISSDGNSMQLSYKSVVSDTTYDEATTTSTGLMSASDKTKLSRLNVYFGTCNTTSDIAEKEVVLTNGDGFELVPGTIVGVKFTYGNNASNSTLNVNGTGAKSIWVANSELVTPDRIYSGEAGFVLYYMYDGSHWAYLGLNYFSDTRGVAYCTTSGNYANKYCYQDRYTLRENNYINVVIRYDNTAQSALTFNIIGTGAKPIYINGEPSSATNYTLPAGAYIAYYDGEHYQFRTDGKIPGPGIVGDAATVDGHAVETTISEDSNNIPTSTAVVEYAKNAFPTVTLSGNPVNTKGAITADVENMVITLKPTQTGSGDASPTNIRPIVGATAATITQEVGNLWPFGDPQSAQGTQQEFPLKGGNTYRLSTATPDTATGWAVRFWYADGSGSELHYTNTTFTLAQDVSGITWNTYAIEGAALHRVITTTVNWQDEAGTVYSGTLDLKTGILTADMLYLTLGESITPAVNTRTDSGCYAYSTSTHRPYFEIGWTSASHLEYSIDDDRVDEVMVDSLPLAAQTDNSYWLSSTSNYHYSDGRDLWYFNMQLPETSSLAEARAWFAEHPVHVLYPLKYPKTYQLTPVQIQTLIGDNTFSMDASGSIDITYRAKETRRNNVYYGVCESEGDAQHKIATVNDDFILEEGAVCFIYFYNSNTYGGNGATLNVNGTGEISLRRPGVAGLSSSTNWGYSTGIQPVVYRDGVWTLAGNLINLTTSITSGLMSYSDKRAIDGFKSIELTNEDLNDLHPLQTTFYWAENTNTCAHKPTAISITSFALLCIRTTTAWMLQICLHPTSNRQWRRYYNSQADSWSGWSEITYSWPVTRTYSGLMTAADKIKLDDLKASTINVTDTYGVTGTAGATVTIQALMDAIASKV